MSKQKTLTHAQGKLWVGGVPDLSVQSVSQELGTNGSGNTTGLMH